MPETAQETPQGLQQAEEALETASTALETGQPEIAEEALEEARTELQAQAETLAEEMQPTDRQAEILAALENLSTRLEALEMAASMQQSSQDLTEEAETIAPVTIEEVKEAAPAKALTKRLAGRWW